MPVTVHRGARLTGLRRSYTVTGVDPPPAPHSMLQEPPRERLIPIPAQLSLLTEAPLRRGTSLATQFSGVATPRLERAAAAFVALWGDGNPSRARGTATLEIDCAAESAAYPPPDADESYRLEVARREIRIASNGEWGAMRAFATLAQLAGRTGDLPAVCVEDRPRFAWRGLMLDVARHFIGVEALLRTLDAMALYKLNVLHLHLTDDQAFRFPSAAFPRLATGPAYTRDELRQVVAHAATLGIRVVPELDMPGHVTSWLAAYPEWGVRPVEPSRRFGVHQACLDPTRREVYEAVERLVDEVTVLFPDAFVHIGGDEVHPSWWSENAGVLAYMAQHGIEDVRALQAQFTRRVAGMVASRGRRVIAWDEVLHPDVGPEVTVQTWRGSTARNRARRAGHACVISANYYLDLFFPADVHYGFDPSAPESELLAREDALLDDPRLAHVADGMRWTRQWRSVADGAPRRDVTPGAILGAEACLWSELVDEATLDIRLWSRMPALAERFWSPAAVRDGEDMLVRLRRSLNTLAAVTGIAIDTERKAHMARAGVTEAWQPLVEMLEPVKWYARLLGEQALAARLAGKELPQSRPYDAATPLDRVVDALPPESFAARDLDRCLHDVEAGQAEATRRLRELAERWSRLPAHGAGPTELEPLAGALIRLGQAVLAVLNGALEPDRALERVRAEGRPFGEYLLAPVPVLAGWLEARVHAAGPAESRPAAGEHDQSGGA
jgi:hexosaminidase